MTCFRDQLSIQVMLVWVSLQDLAVFPHMVIFLTLFHTTGKRRGCLSKLACTLKRPWGTKTESFTSFPNSSLLPSSLQGSVHALHCPFSYHSNAGSSLGHAHVSLCFIMSESCSPCMRPSRVLASPNMPFLPMPGSFSYSRKPSWCPSCWWLWPRPAQQDVCLAPFSWCHHYPWSHGYLVNIENRLTSHWCSPCASTVSWALWLPRLSPFHLHFP